MPELRIAPSILSADFARLGAEVGDVEAGGADWIHVDVMDGHFVPNLTIGVPVVQSLARIAKRPLDVHLMITDPWKYAPEFAKAGASSITFHLEVAERGDGRGLLHALRRGGTKAGLALNPDCAIERVRPYLDAVDLVLVMSVFAGFGGQKFMPEVLRKVETLRREYRFEGDVEMDGGIGLETIGSCAKAGANVFVAGTAVFGAADRKQRIAELRKLAGG
jgi:ribulose-phosphate 3-epimerase